MSAPFFSTERWRWWRMVMGCSTVLFFVGSGTMAPAQEKKKTEQVVDDDEEESDFDQYMDLVKSSYFPASRSDKSQLIRLTFDVSTDIPVGTRFFLELLYQSTAIENSTFELKNNLRRGVVFDWKPARRLGVDKYYLRVSVPLAQQVPDVQEVFKAKKTRFPPEHEPWGWSFLQDEFAIAVGTPAEKAAQKKRILEFYNGKIDELINNMSELLDGMDELKQGKRFRDGGSFDEKAFKAFFKDWCKKQAIIQKSIQDLEPTEPGVFNRTRAAHYQLANLGRMVSKRAWQLQTDVTKKYKVPPFRLDFREPNDAVLGHFDRVYGNYKVDKSGLNKRLKKIDLILTNLLKEEEEEEAKAEEGKKTGKTGK